MRLHLGGIGDAFADRNFRIYSIGAVVSWISFYVQVVAVSWTTWELTHSTAWLAMVAALDVAPTLIFLPLGGVLADRIDRYRIIVVTYGLALLQALALALLDWSGHMSVTALSVLAVLHGLIHSFSMPGLYGLLPRFVGAARLPSAIAVASAYAQLAVFVGPALAGLIIARDGAGLAYASNVAGYAIYLVSIAFLQTPAGYKPPTPSGRSVVGDVVDGIGYILGHRGIVALLAVRLVGDALGAAVVQMLPAFAATGLGRGVDGMASLLAATGAGATLAALWLAHGGVARARPQHVLSAFLLSTLAIAALMLMHSLAMAVVVMGVYGMASEIRRTATVTLLQIAVPDQQRGRVMSTQFLLQRVANGAGALAIGFAADLIGLRPAMLAGTVVGLAAWTVAFSRRGRIGAAFAPSQAAREDVSASRAA